MDLEETDKRYNEYLERYCGTYRVNFDEAEKHAVVKEVAKCYNEELTK